MIVYWEKFESPSSVQEALDLLKDYQGQAVLLAGGTDLIVNLEREHATLPVVIDLMGIPRLQQINELESGWEIGSAVTLTQVLQHPELSRVAPQLMEAISEIGSVQIRNSATLVGNVTNASPAADAVPSLMTLDADVVIASLGGERTIPLNEFFIGPGETVCGEKEMVVSLRIPKPELNWVGAFEKLGLRQAMSISVVNMAANVAWADGKVVSARLAIGAVAPTPILAENAAQQLVNTSLDDPSIEKASSLALQAIDPIDDIRGSASYRSRMVQVLIGRGLRRIRTQQVV
jgi:carbon-monoxide dehydrogenase medium subunit